MIPKYRFCYYLINKNYALYRSWFQWDKNFTNIKFFITINVHDDYSHGSYYMTGYCINNDPTKIHWDRSNSLGGHGEFDDNTGDKVWEWFTPKK